MSLAYLIYLVCSTLCSAEPERPISVSLHGGALTVRSLDLNGSDTFGIVGLDLHTQLTDLLGYDLSFGVASSDREGPGGTLRLFSAGFTFQRSFRHLDGRYRVAMGALSGRGARMIVSHGPQAILFGKKSWPLKVSLSHVIENDWIQSFGYEEYYKSFHLSLGTGITF